LVGALLVIEDVAEEYDLELVHVEKLGDVQKQGIRISFNL